MKPVHTLVRSMVFDETDIEDLVQEIFLRAFRGLSNFNGTAKVSTWVHQIALNATLSYLTERKTSDRPSGAMEAQVAPMTDADPVEQAYLAETGARIEAALETLTPNLRAAIVLTAQLGCTPGQAARIAGCTLATMHWRIFRARGRLRDRLKDLFEPGDEP